MKRGHLEVQERRLLAVGVATPPARAILRPCQGWLQLRRSRPREPLEPARDSHSPPERRAGACCPTRLPASVIAGDDAIRGAEWAGGWRVQRSPLRLSPEHPRLACSAPGVPARRSPDPRVTSGCHPTRVSHAPEPARLHGIAGHIIDTGANASYFEAPMQEDVLFALLAAAQRHDPVALERGGERTHAVIQRCWYNTERRRVLVQFLDENGGAGHLASPSPAGQGAG